MVIIKNNSTKSFPLVSLPWGLAMQGVFGTRRGAMPRFISADPLFFNSPDVSVFGWVSKE